MCFQSIRTVRDISRDDRARIATSRLLTSTDRLNENYSIDLPCSFTPTEEGEPGVYISSSPLTPDNCYFEVVILDPGETGYTSELGRNSGLNIHTFQIKAPQEQVMLSLSTFFKYVQCKHVSSRYYPSDFTIIVKISEHAPETFRKLSATFFSNILLLKPHCNATSQTIVT